MHNSVWINPIIAKTRTLKTLIVPNEKDPEGSNSKSGADDGIVLLGGVKRVYGCRLQWLCHFVVKPSPSAASRSNHRLTPSVVGSHPTQNQN